MKPTKTQNASAQENDSYAEHDPQNGSQASPQSGEIMTNLKQKVKRSINKPDLDAYDPEKQIIERTDQTNQQDQFGIYLNDYALAKKKTFQPSELGDTEGVQTPVHVPNFNNIFDVEHPKDSGKQKTLKKQNTILESFYTEEMDFYDLEEEQFQRPLGDINQPKSGGQSFRPASLEEKKNNLEDEVVNAKVSEVDSIRFNVTLGKEQTKDNQLGDLLQVRQDYGTNQGIAQKSVTLVEKSYAEVGERAFEQKTKTFVSEVPQNKRTNVNNAVMSSIDQSLNDGGSNATISRELQEDQKAVTSSDLINKLHMRHASNQISHGKPPSSQHSICLASSFKAASVSAVSYHKPTAQEAQRIVKKFNKVFGNQFKGHKEHVQKQWDRLQKIHTSFKDREIQLQVGTQLNYINRNMFKNVSRGNYEENQMIEDPLPSSQNDNQPVLKPNQRQHSISVHDIQQTFLSPKSYLAEDQQEVEPLGTEIIKSTTFGQQAIDQQTEQEVQKQDTSTFLQTSSQQRLDQPNLNEKKHHLSMTENIGLGTSKLQLGAVHISNFTRNNIVPEVVSQIKEISIINSTNDLCLQISMTEKHLNNYPINRNNRQLNGGNTGMTQSMSRLRNTGALPPIHKNSKIETPQKHNGRIGLNSVARSLSNARLSPTDSSLHQSMSQPRIPSVNEIRDSKAVFTRLQRDNRLRRQRLASKADEARKIEQSEVQEKIKAIHDEKQARAESAQKRRDIVRERMEQSRKRQEEQKQKFQLAKEKFKVQQRKKPLYKMLEESFTKSQQDKVQERKKVLEKIKLQKRPVDFDKLNAHAIQHDKFVMKLQCKKADKNAQSQSDQFQKAYVPKYRSKFYLRNLEQEQTRKEMEEAKSELKQLLHDKKRSYARYVQDVHRPLTSYTKTKELENLIERIKHPVRPSQRISPGTSLPLLPPINGLQQSIRRVQQRRAVSQADQESIRNRDLAGVGDSLYGQRGKMVNNTSLGIYKTKTQNDIRSQGPGRFNIAESSGPFIPMINHSPARSDIQEQRSFKRPPLPSVHALTSQKHVHQGDKFQFLKAQKGRLVMHQDSILKSIKKGQKKSHKVQKGDWKLLMDNYKLSQMDRHLKVKMIAENLEKNALRREYIIKQKADFLRNTPSKLVQGKNNKIVLSNRLDNKYMTASEVNPIRKVDISSVHVPSDASPQLNKDLKILDRRAFGGHGANLYRQELPVPGPLDSNLEWELNVADEGEEVNEMLIDAIKAKLAILDEMDK